MQRWLYSPDYDIVGIMAQETKSSRAGGYAEISSRTAWMAYYYPTEYMCATLNSFIDKNDKIKLYMSVCKKKKINILPPDVNLSEKKFCVDGDSIRFGLRGIKQMGDISGQIIEERNTRGFFTGYQDFAERMSKYQKVSKKVLEGLIFSGAIDGFEGTRREKIEILPQILKVASTEKKNYESGQISLFDAMLSNEDNSLKDELEELKNIKMPKLGEYDKRYKLEKEKEFAGFYVTEHPLDDYTEIISEQGIYELGFLSHDSDENEEDDFEYSLDGEVVKVAGIIKEKKNIITKKGDLMSIFSIEDTTGEIRCVAFPKDFKKNEDKIYHP